MGICDPLTMYALHVMNYNGTYKFVVESYVYNFRFSRLDICTLVQLITEMTLLYCKM